MDLLLGMLDVDPFTRLSSRDALNHPAFDEILSRSPLIITKPVFNQELRLYQSIIKDHYNRTEEEYRENLPSRRSVPNRIEEMSRSSVSPLMNLRRFHHSNDFTIRMTSVSRDQSL